MSRLMVQPGGKPELARWVGCLAEDFESFLAVNGTMPGCGRGAETACSWPKARSSWGDLRGDGPVVAVAVQTTLTSPS